MSFLDPPDASPSPPDGEDFHLTIPETADEVTGEFDPSAREVDALAGAAATLDRLQRALAAQPGDESVEPQGSAPPDDLTVTALETQLHRQIEATQRAEARADRLADVRVQLQDMLGRIRGAAETLLARDQEAGAREQKLRETVVAFEPQVAALQQERQRLVREVEQAVVGQARAEQQVEAALAHREAMQQELEELSHNLELRSTTNADLQAQLAHATGGVDPGAFEREMAMARQLINGLEDQCTRSEAKLGQLQAELTRKTVEGDEIRLRARLMRQQLIELGVPPKEPPARPPSDPRTSRAR